MPQGKVSIQDFQKQAELDLVFAGKSSGRQSNLIRSMQADQKFSGQPQGGGVIALMPTSPTDLALETIMAGISESGRANPLALMAGAIATGRYGGKIAKNVGRRGVGRVLTQIDPFYYENKIQELKRLLTTKKGISSIIKDEPPRLFDSLGQSISQVGREEPFRRMFGLKPRKGLSGVYTKNKDGSYSFNKDDDIGSILEKEVQLDIISRKTSGNSVMGSYGAKDSFSIEDGIPSIHREYEDIWDFKINEREKIFGSKTNMQFGSKINMQRYLVDKITKPITIKGKVSSRGLLDASPKSGRNIYFEKYDDWYYKLMANNVDNPNAGIPSVEWIRSVAKNEKAKKMLLSKRWKLSNDLRSEAESAYPFQKNKNSAKYKLYNNLNEALRVK